MRKVSLEFEIPFYPTPGFSLRNKLDIGKGRLALQTIVSGLEDPRRDIVDILFFQNQTFGDAKPNPFHTLYHGVRGCGQPKGLAKLRSAISVEMSTGLI